MPRYGPGYELTRRVIQVLRSDAELTTILFPPAKPQQYPDDRRIFHARSNLAAHLRPILPRIVIANQPDFHDWQQPDLQNDSAEVSLFMHVIAELGFTSLAEAADARARRVLQSTDLSSARMITAPLVPVGPRYTVNEAEFQDAVRITSRYSSTSVGVLA